MIPQVYIVIGFLAGTVFAILLLLFAMAYDHKRASKNARVHQAKCTTIGELFELLSLIQTHNATIAWLSSDDLDTEYTITFKCADEEFGRIFNKWLGNPFKDMVMEVE